MGAFRIPNLSLLKSTVELFRLSSKNHAERAIFILFLCLIFSHVMRNVSEIQLKESWKTCSSKRLFLSGVFSYNLTLPKRQTQGILGFQTTALLKAA